MITIIKACRQTVSYLVNVQLWSFSAAGSCQTANDCHATSAEQLWPNFPAGPFRVCSPTSVLPKSVWDSTLSKNRTCLPYSRLYPLYYMMDWGLSYLVGRGGNEVWGRRRGSLTGSDWSVGDSDLYESYRGLEAHKKHVWFIKMWLRGVIIYKSLAVIITRVLTDDQRE